MKSDGGKGLLPMGSESAALYSKLRARILTGEYGKGNFLPSIRKLGGEFEVSFGTVCRALKVLAEDRLVVSRPRHGYEVIHQAYAVEQGRLVCLVLRMSSDWARQDIFSRFLLNHVMRAVAQHGWSLMSIDYLGRTAEDMVEEMKAAGVWGVIVDAYSPEIVRMARQSGITAVAVDAWHPGMAVDTIVQDDFQGGYLAGSYLASRGHERFAWVGQTTETHHATSRLGGVLAGLRAEQGCLSAGGAMEEIAGRADLSAVRASLARADRPTGWFALWREQAVGVVRIASELGLRPGRDFDMISWCSREEYDDSKGDTLDGFAVPMIVWKIETMARTAALRLAERHRNPALPALKMTIETELIAPVLSKVL